MAAELEHLAVGPRTKGVRRMAPWSLTPVLPPLPQEASGRRCTQCRTEKRPRRRPEPDGPSTLCNVCCYPSKNSASAAPAVSLKNSVSAAAAPMKNLASAAASSKNTLFGERPLLQSNSRRRQGRPSKKPRLSSKENSAAGNNKDAFFDHTGLEVSWKPERAEEKELECLSNKEAPALDAPRARSKGRRRVTATETTSQRANVLPHDDLRAEKETVRRCTHCATEKTPLWRDGPEGPRTLCNACGVVLRRTGRLLPEYRPANSPAFSPLLHSNKHRRVLEMHRQNKTTSACHGEARSELMEGRSELMDAIFDHTGLDMSWEEAGPEQAAAEEEELEWLSNMDAFPSVETMAVSVEEAPPLGAPPARTKGRRCVTADAVQQRLRCTHCTTEETPQWRVGPEGPRTLCNACGVVLRTTGRLLPEYRPANSPAFSPLLHSNKHRRALQMHRQNKTTSACHGELMEGHLLPPANGPVASSTPLQHRNPIRQERLQNEEGTSAAGRATAEACIGEKFVEVQPLLPERPLVDRPSFSLVYHRRVLQRRRKSEEENLLSSAP